MTVGDHGKMIGLRCFVVKADLKFRCWIVRFSLGTRTCLTKGLRELIIIIMAATLGWFSISCDFIKADEQLYLFSGRIHEGKKRCEPWNWCNSCFQYERKGHCPFKHRPYRSIVSQKSSENNTCASSERWWVCNGSVSFVSFYILLT